MFDKKQYMREWRAANPDRVRIHEEHAKPVRKLSRAARNTVKKELVNQFLGCSCRMCGWNEFPEGLHAHHVDPTLKFRSKRPQPVHYLPFEKLEPELRKCIRLCAICHAGVTAGRLQLTKEQEQLL